MELFGESARRKIKTTANAMGQHAITIDIKPLDHETLAWFTPLYESRMKQMYNPIIFDICSTTLHNPNTSKVYYSLSLFEAGTPLGATIFSVVLNRLSIAYRTYPKKWQKADLPASPSLFAEWAIAEYAAQLNIKKFVHGRNRNPYGTFSSIGLAIFKLSVGCIPKKSKKFELLSTDSANFTQDVLILLPPDEPTKHIQSAYLIVASKNFRTYEQVTKYPQRLNVEVIFRNLSSNPNRTF